jgi:hypothetical protein
MRSTGNQGLVTQGLREAGNAQRNGLIASHTTSNDPLIRKLQLPHHRLETRFLAYGV